MTVAELREKCEPYMKVCNLALSLCLDNLYEMSETLLSFEGDSGREGTV